MSGAKGNKSENNHQWTKITNLGSVAEWHRTKIKGYTNIENPSLLTINQIFFYRSCVSSWKISCMHKHNI